MVCSQAGHTLIGFGVKLCSPSITSKWWDCQARHTLIGFGLKLCSNDMRLPSGPYSDRVWSETLLTLHHIDRVWFTWHDIANPSPMGGCSIGTLLTLHHIQCGSHDMTLPIHRQWVDAALAPDAWTEASDKRRAKSEVTLLQAPYCKIWRIILW